MRVFFTEKSSNSKTGPIPVSTTSADSCPSSCAMFSACYAKSGPLWFRWQEVTDGRRGGDWKTFTDRVATLPDGQLWRHNQAGDLPGEDEVIDGAALGQLVRANRGKRGFTYTHKPPTGDNAILIMLANHDGFTVNLSANNLSHADQLADLGIAPVATVLPETQTRNTTTPAGRKVVVCPATNRDKVSCATCQMCQRRDRDFIIGFPAHGSAKKAANKVATGE